MPLPSTSPETLAFDIGSTSRHSLLPHTPILVRGAISRLDYGSLTLRPVALLALLSEPTRLASSPRGRLPPGFQRLGHPRRRRISLQCQLGNLHWRDSHPLDHQLASLHDPMRPTPEHIPISSLCDLYEMPSLCASIPTPWLPASGSVLSLAVLYRHVVPWDPGKFIGCMYPVPSPMTLAFDA